MNCIGLFPLLQVNAATNRADILDPALMRSGRLDRKIEFPHPTEEARARILQVGLSLNFFDFNSITLAGLIKKEQQVVYKCCLFS